ncbi:MAG: SynChlorMet cassette radical SAM/SPASM protein ScmE [Candidatus Margulisiibacteriota bacterium]
MSDHKLMQTPKSLEIDITNNCNLRCKYCSHFESAGEVARDLPAADWLKFFEECSRCAILDLTICGGEPFFRPDLIELINGIIKNRMRFSILSNGTLITDEIAAFLASTKRCSSVQVSIDGSIPTTHDACRGPGSFQKALAGLLNLRKFKIPATVRVTIHRHNVRELDNIAKMLIEEIGLSGFSTNSASHLGECQKNAEITQLTPDERYIAMEALLRLNQKYNNCIGANAGPLSEAKFWLKMIQAKRDGLPGLPGAGFLTSCGGVFSKLGVRADGVITPCGQMPHIELGHINKDSLKDIWQNHPELKRLRERRQTPLSDFAFCKDCEYIPYCRGGCPALAYTLTGGENQPSPDCCLRNYLKADGKLPDEKLLLGSEECACHA